MADEEDLAFEELEEPDDLADADLDELEDDDVIADDEETDVADVLVVDEVDAEVDIVDEVVEEPVAVVAAVAEEDDDEEEDDDDLDPDDVEAGLDVILKDRLVVVEDVEEEEAPDPEERVEGAAKALTKRPGEFTCQSCFLVKHPSQLADPDRMLCRDCV